MWYVIQTVGGQEDQVNSLMLKLVDDRLIQESFIPRYEVMKRIKGAWVKRAEVLLPGYVFVVTKDPGKLKESLRNVPRFTRLLGNDAICSPLLKTARSPLSTRSPNRANGRWSFPPA